MKSNQSIIKSALLALALPFVAMSISSAFAQDNGRKWDVKGDLVGKKDKVSEDLSGIACATASGFPRTCLVIDDELQSAQIVTLTDGALMAGRSISLINDTFDGKPMELDGEGVAYADGYFYVIGSQRGLPPPAS